MKERTLSIVKPEAVRKGLTEPIGKRLKAAGLEIVARKKMTLTEAQARRFYDIHREQPFFESLVLYMASGEIVAQILEGENAVKRNREAMGATDPAKASAGTIRADYGESVEANAVHGSDSAETARQEIAFFFGADKP